MCQCDDLSGKVFSGHGPHTFDSADFVRSKREHRARRKMVRSYISSGANEIVCVSSTLQGPDLYTPVPRGYNTTMIYTK